MPSIVARKTSSGFMVCTFPLEHSNADSHAAEDASIVQFQFQVNWTAGCLFVNPAPMYMSADPTYHAKLQC
jgi:hypothetical protein